MENLARALLSAAIFLELSGDDLVDPDAALRALEQMAADLAHATPAEREVLGRVGAELAKEASSAGPAFAAQAAFLESFLASVGLEG